MKIIEKHNIIRLISIVVVPMSFIGLVVACSRPIGMLKGTVAGVSEEKEIATVEVVDERQEIINYIESVRPILKDHADFYEDADKLSSRGNITKNQAINILNDLRYRIEKISTDVAGFHSPPALQEFKGKWLLECELLIKSLTMAMRSIEENDMDLARESGDHKSRASEIRDEHQKELFDVLAKYGISVSELR